MKCYQVEFFFSFLYFSFGEIVGFGWVFGLELLGEIGVEVFIVEESFFSLILLVYKLFEYIRDNFSDFNDFV